MQSVQSLQCLQSIQCSQQDLQDTHPDIILDCTGRRHRELHTCSLSPELLHITAVVALNLFGYYRVLHTWILECPDPRRRELRNSTLSLEVMHIIKLDES